ncbi:MAG: hypothetical protein AABX15_05435 [Thermoproteota archaeon]|nr:hypothetical protein [Nitrosopumilaceae archaeon]
MAKTPEQKWKESIRDYRKKCQQILNISKSIRYVGAINEYGRTLTGIIRPGIKPLLKSEDAKNEFFIVSNLITLRNSQATVLGDLDYALLKHKKVILIIIPNRNATFYITIDINVKTISEIISKIKKIL